MAKSQKKANTHLQDICSETVEKLGSMLSGLIFLESFTFLSSVYKLNKRLGGILDFEKIKKNGDKALAS